VKLILNTYNPSDFGGFSYAFVDLNAALATLILKRREAFNQARDQGAGAMGYDLAAMEYHDYSAMFLSGIPDEANIENCDAGGDYDETELPNADFIDLAERTECNRMVITERAVYWTAYPKHDDRALTVETSYIDYDVVERAALEVAA
jgi:hypothetical protein